MKDLQTRLNALPRSRLPAVDLWPAIRDRLEPPQQRWTASRAAAVAAVFFLATMVLRLGSQTPVQQWHDGNLQVLSASVELEYSGALRDLRDSIGGLAGDPSNRGVIAQYEASLQLVHQSTNRVRAALTLDPQSRLLNTMLARLQKQQLGVMRDIALLSESERGKAT